MVDFSTSFFSPLILGVKIEGRLVGVSLLLSGSFGLAEGLTNPGLTEVGLMKPGLVGLISPPGLVENPAFLEGSMLMKVPVSGSMPGGRRSAISEELPGPEGSMSGSLVLSATFSLLLLLLLLLSSSLLLLLLLLLFPKLGLTGLSLRRMFLSLSGTYEPSTSITGLLASSPDVTLLGLKGLFGGLGGKEGLLTGPPIGGSPKEGLGGLTEGPKGLLSSIDGDVGIASPINVPWLPFRVVVVVEPASLLLFSSSTLPLEELSPVSSFLIGLFLMGPSTSESVVP